MSARPRYSRTRIKVCGIREELSARVAADSGADAIGFIFVPGSPRYVSPEAAAPIMMSLPPLVNAVGVTRDLTVEQFNDVYIECPTQVSQFHGTEDEKTISDCCGPCNVRAFRFDPATIGSQLERWGGNDEIDAVLIDGGDGGEGVSLDWNQLAEHLSGFDKPVFLAGGLNPDNVGDAIAAVRPYAVDVSSGVESAPGEKDHDRIRAFCEAVRAADAL